MQNEQLEIVKESEENGLIDILLSLILIHKNESEKFNIIVNEDENTMMEFYQPHPYDTRIYQKENEELGLKLTFNMYYRYLEPEFKWIITEEMNRIFGYKLIDEIKSN